MVKLFVKESALIPIVGLSHNTERGGESILSIITLNYTKSTIKTYFIVETSKEQTINTNSLIR